jgi:hypothetical protein
MMTETTVTVTATDAAPGHNASGQPTVKSDPGQGQGSLDWIRLNILYFRTIPGILKLIQVVFGIVCMACASPAYLAGTHWFLFVAVASFIATLIWIFIYFLSVREALKLPINWILTELLNTSVTAILYLIAFIVQLSIFSAPFHYSIRDRNIAAGVFGLFNTVAYAAGAYFLYVEWKGTRTNN